MARGRKKALRVKNVVKQIRYYQHDWDRILAVSATFNMRPTSFLRRAIETALDRAEKIIEKRKAERQSEG